VLEFIQGVMGGTVHTFSLSARPIVTETGCAVLNGENVVSEGI
jgi:hypothetical protein